MRTALTSNLPAVLQVCVKKTKPVRHARLNRRAWRVGAMVGVALSAAALSWLGRVENRSVAMQSSAAAPVPALTAEEWLGNLSHR